MLVTQVYSWRGGANEAKILHPFFGPEKSYQAKT